MRGVRPWCRRRPRPRKRRRPGIRVQGWQRLCTNAGCGTRPFASDDQLTAGVDYEYKAVNLLKVFRGQVPRASSSTSRPSKEGAKSPGFFARSMWRCVLWRWKFGVHCHDWHTALLPVYLKAYYRDHGLMLYTCSVLVMNRTSFTKKVSFS